MPKIDNMRILFIFFLFTGCLKTEEKTLASPTKNTNTQSTFEKNISAVKTIDARKIFNGKITGDFGNTNLLTITFTQRTRPSITFYKQEIKSGMEFSLIPPNGNMNQIILEKIDSNQNTISKTIHKLKTGVVNKLKI